MNSMKTTYLLKILVCRSTEAKACSVVKKTNLHMLAIKDQQHQTEILFDIETLAEN